MCFIVNCMKRSVLMMGRIDFSHASSVSITSFYNLYIYTSFIQQLTLIELFLLSVSFLNSLYVFTKTRRYTLLEAEVMVCTPASPTFLACAFHSMAIFNLFPPLPTYTREQEPLTSPNARIVRLEHDVSPAWAKTFPGNLM